MTFYIYLIKSSEGYRYIGHTPDLDRRLIEHNSGTCHSTKHGTDWKVIYTEQFPSRGEAMKREKWFKYWFACALLKDILNKYNPFNLFTKFLPLPLLLSI